MGRLALLSALLLALPACVDAGLGRGTPQQRLSLAQVNLDPENARDMINRYRIRNGLKPVTMNAQLTEAARSHSEDLAKLDKIGHKGSDGSDAWLRVKRTGYPAILTLENVGAGQLSMAEVFKGWQDSPTHDRNLLAPDATQMGIALVRNPNSEFRTFWTLVLAKPDRPERQ